jgi:hemerythrin-like domain-containing protein
MDRQQQIDTDQPINSFMQCHAGFVTRLRVFAQLPELVEQARSAQLLAQDMLEMFRGPVLEHHADEERELFPAVLRSAQPGAETLAVQQMVQRLEQEHRSIERQWKLLQPQVSAAARGKAQPIDARAVGELVSAYLLHANFEEQHFLPLAEQILGRNGNHMAALGVALHLRHAPQPVGYV